MSDHSDTLYLEIGNTRAHWRHDGLEYNCAVSAADRELGDLLERVPAIERVFAASVGNPTLLADLEQKSRPGLTWTAPGDAEGSLMSSDYAPGELGLDRWLACYAVASEQPRSQHIVLDAGTAVTIDLLDHLHHRGGWIIPGFQRWHECLLMGTNIPPWAPSEGRHELGRSTADAVANAWVAAVLGAVSRATELSGPDYRIWLTGGDGPRLERFLRSAEVRTNLVLDGLEAWSVRSTEAGEG